MLLPAAIWSCDRPGSLEQRAVAAVARSAPAFDTATLVMRNPETLYRLGVAHPDWRGRAILDGTRLEFEFPAIAADNVGCSPVDSARAPVGGPRPWAETQPAYRQHRRRYYWIAAADFPAWPPRRYRASHFLTARVDFDLSPEVLPTPARLDSAFAAAAPRIAEARGEPPSEVQTTEPEATLVRREPAELDGRPAWRVRLVLHGAAVVQEFLRTRADSIRLTWCQRDQWLTGIQVPLERR